MDKPLNNLEAILNNNRQRKKKEIIMKPWHWALIVAALAAFVIFGIPMLKTQTKAINPLTGPIATSEPSSTSNPAGAVAAADDDPTDDPSVDPLDDPGSGNGAPSSQGATDPKADPKKDPASGPASAPADPKAPPAVAAADPKADPKTTDPKVDPKADPKTPATDPAKTAANQCPPELIAKGYTVCSDTLKGVTEILAEKDKAIAGLTKEKDEMKGQLDGLQAQIDELKKNSASCTKEVIDEVAVFEVSNPDGSKKYVTAQKMRTVPCDPKQPRS